MAGKTVFKPCAAWYNPYSGPCPCRAKAMRPGSGAARTTKRNTPAGAHRESEWTEMKFSEMPYERPDLTAAFAQFDAMAQAIAAAPGAAAVMAQYGA